MTGWGKKKKKIHRCPNPDFCFGPFLPPSIVHMCMQSIQLEQNQLQIAAHAEDASWPTRDEKKRNPQMREDRDRPRWHARRPRFLSVLTVLWGWPARLKRGACNLQPYRSFPCHTVLFSVLSSALCSGPGVEAQRIGGPDQPRPTHWPADDRR